MDNTYSDLHVENDNTEHIRGKRLSSILKAPRSPLHDLGSGNEFTQDINVEKRRKNSRRVSFADTINCRVFQRDHKTNVAEKENEECVADTRKQILLNQNEEQEPEVVPCEITGMDTLLHAPIQALVQQPEWHNAENTTPRTNRHDTTVIFSDENEMDMTAPHTAVITHGLENNQTDTTENTPSALPGLKSNDGNSEMNKEIHISCDPSNNSCPSSEEKLNATAGKKINFNAFLMSLKSNKKVLNPIEGPEKENVFFGPSQVSEDVAPSSAGYLYSHKPGVTCNVNSNKKVLNPIEGPEKENIFFGPSQVSEDVAPSSAGYLYSHEPEATCNVTKIFRGQDDGMEMTRCQASDFKTLFPATCEAPAEQLVRADVTEAFVDDGMDMTMNHTAKLSLPSSNIKTQSLNFKKSFLATALGNNSFGPSQVSEDVAPSSAGYLYSHKPEATCNVTKIFRGQDDGMEMTRCQASDFKTVFPATCEAPAEQLVCADVTETFVDDGMDMTMNHTAKLSLPSSNIETQSLTFKKNFPATALGNNSFGPSQVSEDVAPSSAGYLYAHEPEATCNVTKIFREQDDGMEMTRCQASDFKTVFAGTCEAPPEQAVRADVTEAFVDDGMDMTMNHTAKLSLPSSNIKTQSLNFKKDFLATALGNNSSGPSQVSEDMAPSSAGYLYSHEPEATCNVTKIFRGQDDGMEMTRCQTSDFKTVLPGTCEAPAEQLVCADVTETFIDDGMDMTMNHTAKLFLPSSTIETQSLNFKKNFPATTLGNNSILKRTPKLRLLVQENPQLCTDKTTVKQAENRLDATTLQAVDQQPQTTSAIPGSASFDSVFQCDKTVAFSIGDDMEITGNHTGVIDNESTKEMGSLCSKAVEKTANAKSSLVEHSHPVCDDARDDAKNLADHFIPKVLCGGKLNLDKEAGQEVLSNSRATVFVMDDMENTETHNGALQKTALQGRQHNQSISLTSIDKTIMFTGKQNDMEMTVDNSIHRILSQDRLNLAKQAGEETVSNGKTVVFNLPEDMEITRTHTAVLSGELDLQDRPSTSLPVDKTIVFSDSQEDMEITAPHTFALSGDVTESKNQELPCKSTRQLNSQGVLSASGREGTSCAEDLAREYPAEPKDKPDPSASSASVFPSEKETIRGHSDAVADSVCAASLPEDALDVHTHPRATRNCVAANHQDLGKLKSRRMSSKLPSNSVVDFSEGGEDPVSHVLPPLQQPDSLKNGPDTLSTQGNQGLKDDSSRQEDPAADLALDGSKIVPVSNSKSHENEVFSPEGEKLPEDFPINSKQADQLSGRDIPGDQVDPTLVPKLSGILNVCSKLKNIRRRSAVVSVSEGTYADHLPTLAAQAEDTLSTGKNAAEEENVCLEAGAAPVQANTGTALMDKYQGINIPLGIFLPKLPNRRKPSVSNEQGINVKSSGKMGAVVSEVSPDPAESPGGNNCTGQNLDLSQFIQEEFLPVFAEEADSNESVNSELEGGSNEVSKGEMPYNERTQSENTRASDSPKRALEHDEKALPQLKKLKMDESLDAEDSQALQVISAAVSKSQIEVHEDGHSPAKSPDCTQANTSSSLDSVKADTELTIQRSSQMESQLFMDSICEENLRERLQSGVITVGEFFTLLQVHISIQKPRQSHLPANCAVNTPPAEEDLLYSQYIYCPKVRIYEEDCQALSQMIEELKPYANVQNQLLVDVNRSLWEVMRTCSDEQLNNFGAELNKMKSYFTKESKILAHNGKETLYSKLLQSTQEQWKELQMRKTKMEEILTEAESCLAALEGDSDWDEFEATCKEKAGCESEELENLRAQEEQLQRELSDLESENEQGLAEINELQRKEKSCEEFMNTYNNEWEISEWSDQQAVFTFLYDSIEFTVVFGSPVDGEVFGGFPCRKIESMSFESLLEEKAAPLSSRLVQRLIFQFIESKGCWQEKCPTLHYLPKVLYDISLVVSRCKALGEEIEFLEKWGGKFNLLKTDINNTKVKLLFSSSTAFAKFELTLALSASYPSAPLPFTVQTKIGNIGEEEISAVVSKVPTGYHYLQRMVSSIHQNLL